MMLFDALRIRRSLRGVDTEVVDECFDDLDDLDDLDDPPAAQRAA